MKRKLGLNSNCCISQRVPEEKVLELMKAVGFQSFFTGSDGLLDQGVDVLQDRIQKLREKADELGLEFLAIHAPLENLNAMWMPGDEYLEIYNGMIQTIDVAEQYRVPYVVIHASGGWKVPPISEIGLARYDAIMDYAAKKKIIIAVENSRVIGNLAYFTERYEDNPYVRFCYDSGHEHGFTKTVNWMDIFCDRMALTHIHDNFGRGQERVGMPDLHLLPFDGNIDYAAMMKKFDEYNYTGTLMLEVFVGNNEMYRRMTPEEFVATAYERIERISRL